MGGRLLQVDEEFFSKGVGVVATGVGVLVDEGWKLCEDFDDEFVK